MQWQGDFLWRKWMPLFSPGTCRYLYWWKLQIVSWILGYVAVEVWRPPPTAPHQQLHVVKMFADDDGAPMRTSSPQQQWTWTTSTDQMVVGSPAFLSTGWANLTFSLKAVLWHWRVSLFDHPASWQLPIGWCWIGCFDPGFTWICHGKAKTRMLSPTPCRNLSGERLQSFDMTWHDYVDVLTLASRKMKDSSHVKLSNYVPLLNSHTAFGDFEDASFLFQSCAIGVSDEGNLLKGFQDKNIGDTGRSEVTWMQYHLGISRKHF